MCAALSACVYSDWVFYFLSLKLFFPLFLQIIRQAHQPIGERSVHCLYSPVHYVNNACQEENVFANSSLQTECVNTHIYVYTYVRVLMHAYIHIYIYMYVQLLHVCAYTHIRTPSSK